MYQSMAQSLCKSRLLVYYAVPGRIMALHLVGVDEERTSACPSQKRRLVHGLLFISRSASGIARSVA